MVCAIYTHSLYSHDISVVVGGYFAREESIYRDDDTSTFLCKIITPHKLVHFLKEEG